MARKNPDSAAEVRERDDHVAVAAAQAERQVIGLRHIGMVAENPAALAQFYHDVLGLHVVGGSPQDGPFGATAFLTSDPAKESHELAIFTDPAFRHTAFKVGTLAELRAAYQRIASTDLPIKMTFNHGASLAFYFEDPEGNLVEIYWATGVAYKQPYGHPIDLSHSEQELRRDVAQLVLEDADVQLSASVTGP